MFTEHDVRGMVRAIYDAAYDPDKRRTSFDRLALLAALAEAFSWHVSNESANP